MYSKKGLAAHSLPKTIVTPDKSDDGMDRLDPLPKIRFCCNALNENPLAVMGEK